MESRNRVESLGGFEIAAAQEKDQLIARRTQVRGDVLERQEAGPAPGTQRAPAASVACRCRSEALLPRHPGLR
jgi:hypothetical protein